MATNTETRKIEIIADGKKVEASVKAMQAAVAILNNQLRKLRRVQEKVCRTFPGASPVQYCSEIN